MVCLHCQKTFPLYGHLHRFDARKLSAWLVSCGLRPHKATVFGRQTVTATIGRFPSFPAAGLRVVDFLGRLLGLGRGWLAITAEKPNG